MKNDKFKETAFLLNELKSVLQDHGDRNWIRGVSYALDEVSSGTEGGFENARSIFRTMVSGGRGLAEYYVATSDKKYNLKINNRIGDIVSKLWEIFNSNHCAVAAIRRPSLRSACIQGSEVAAR